MMHDLRGRQRSAEVASGVGPQTGSGHSISKDHAGQWQGSPSTLEVALALDPPNSIEQIGWLNVCDSHLPDRALEQAKQIFAASGGGRRPPLLTVTLSLGAVLGCDSVEGVLGFDQRPRLVALLL